VFTCDVNGTAAQSATGASSGLFFGPWTAGGCSPPTPHSLLPCFVAASGYMLGLLDDNQVAPGPGTGNYQRTNFNRPCLVRDGLGATPLEWSSFEKLKECGSDWARTHATRAEWDVCTELEDLVGRFGQLPRRMSKELSTGFVLVRARAWRLCASVRGCARHCWPVCGLRVCVCGCVRLAH